MDHNSKREYPGRTVHNVYNQDFIIDKRFEIVKELGHGAYGIVCSAKCSTGYPDSDCYVAVKKITNIFSKKILCKRSLRELKLLQFFRGHKNITCLYDLDIVPDPETGMFNEVYLYEELMECDMHQIIRSGQPLTDSHFQSFIHQTLCGLKYIHSADVLHRDLKPGNLLVNADCDLKICDFGLARGFSNIQEENTAFMTEYVATRWYRAPEIMLSFSNYSKAIDIWSVGCILAELLGGKPLFRGRDYVDQLNQILLILGTPSKETLSKIGSARAQSYVKSLPYMRKVEFSEIFPSANPLALDLLEKMLTLDPFKRITVEEALKHPYLSVWHDPQEEPVCSMKFDFKSFEAYNDLDSLRSLISQEVKNFREFVRKPISEQQQIQLQLQLQSQQEEDKRYLDPSVAEDDTYHEHLKQDFTYDGTAMNIPTVAQDSFNSINSSSLHRGVDTNTGEASSETNAQYYESIPKPQELDDFNFSTGKCEEMTPISDQSNVDLFRLEEDLGFGLDNPDAFRSI